MVSLPGLALATRGGVMALLPEDTRGFRGDHEGCWHWLLEKTCPDSNRRKKDRNALMSRHGNGSLGIRGCARARLPGRPHIQLMLGMLPR